MPSNRRAGSTPVPGRKASLETGRLFLYIRHPELDSGSGKKDSETQGAARLSWAKTVHWTVFSESPSSYAAKVQNDEYYMEFL